MENTILAQTVAGFSVDQVPVLMALLMGAAVGTIQAVIAVKNKADSMQYDAMRQRLMDNDSFMDEERRKHFDCEQELFRARLRIAELATELEKYKK